MKGPTASELITGGVIKGTATVDHFYLHRGGICSLIDSRQEETNLTSKFKMQGPNTSKRIMSTIGPRKDRSQVLEGSQDLFCPIPV
jgi:hypothetical protein